VPTSVEALNNQQIIPNGKDEPLIRRNFMAIREWLRVIRDEVSGNTDILSESGLFDYVIDDAGNYIVDDSGNRIVVPVAIQHSSLNNDEPLLHSDAQRSAISAYEIDFKGAETQTKTLSNDANNVFTIVNPVQNRVVIIEMVADALSEVTMPATAKLLRGGITVSATNWLWIKCVDSSAPVYLFAWSAEAV